MKATWKKGLTVTVAALLMGMNVHAEDATQTVSGAGSSAATVATPAPAAKIMGGIDIRPSWTTKSGEMHSENSVMLGASFTKDTALFGVYNFQTNIHDPSNDPKIQGMNFSDVDFSLRGKINNIATLGSTGISVGYAPRLYLPILTAMQQEGYIASLRNYINFKKELSSVVTVTLTEMPILHLYSRSGNVTATGSSANRFFENRVYLIGDFNITDKLSLSVPVMFHVTRYNDFAVGAKNNNAWNYFAWVNPEMTYQIDDRFAVAVGYYSDNLVAADLSEMTISNGLEKGVLQFSMQASL